MEPIKAFFVAFGFLNWHEFWVSLVKPKLFKTAAALSALFAPLYVVIEQVTGLTPPLFFCFILLNFMEWYTGIRASKWEATKKGKKFVLASLKMQRFLLKVIVYMSAMSILRQYAIHAGGNMGYETSGAFWDWTFWAVFNYISLILTRSIFENLHRMEIKEATQIHALLDNKFTRFFALLTAPPDEEKTQR